ncbi:MAG: hydrogenase maturation nickel metallochaperone HypA [bacterium]
MHELAVTEEIIRLSLEVSKGKKISAINIVIGELSSFVDDSVQFYFDILSKSTLAEGATLLFRRVPTKLRCYNCGKEFHPDSTMTCPFCNHIGGEVIEGEEFYIDSIEVRDED